MFDFVGGWFVCCYFFGLGGWECLGSCSELCFCSEWECQFCERLVFILLEVVGEVICQFMECVWFYFCQLGKSVEVFLVVFLDVRVGVYVFFVYCCYGLFCWGE